MVLKHHLFAGGNDPERYVVYKYFHKNRSLYLNFLSTSSKVVYFETIT
jgi:hypothetical protein